jgi:hypothetical protein
MPAFVVNGDVRIFDLNDAAVQFCGQTLNMVFKVRGGDVLGCLHAVDVSAGCGRGPACQECIIRNSVKLCLEGQVISHRFVNLQISHGMDVKELQLLVTASPLPNEDEELALLIIEHIPEIAEMNNVVPICMKCKRAWDEDQYWIAIEEYFHARAGVRFARGLCPDCAKRFSGY